MSDQEIKGEFKNWFIDVPIGVITVLLTLAAATTFAVPFFDWFIVPPTGDEPAHIKPFARMAMIFLFAMSAGLVLKTITQYLHLKKLTAEHAQSGNASIAQNEKARADRLQFKLDDMLSKAHKIFKRIYAIDRPKASFTKIRQSYQMQADGLVLAEEEFELLADKEPLAVWPFAITADQTAEPQDWIDTLKLRITSLDGDNNINVDYLPYENAEDNKELAVFFLPEIAPGTSRKVKVTYEWPGYANDLLEKDKTVFSFTHKSVDLHDEADVEYKFRFSAALGNIHFEELGPPNLEQSYTKPENLDDYHCWTFRKSDQSVGNKDIEFLATRNR